MIEIHGGLKIGYARVSTEDQKLDRQIDALKAYGVDRIVEEKYTGTKRDRDGIKRLFEVVRPGDTVVVESVSRLGRRTIDVLQLIEDLEEMGVKFVSLKENFDTSTAIGKAMLQMMAVCAELERNQLVERIKEGIKASRKRGKRVGRPRVDRNKINHALSLYDSGNYSIREICKLAEVSQGTLYRAINERKLKQMNANAK